VRRATCDGRRATGDGREDFDLGIWSFMRRAESVPVGALTARRLLLVASNSFWVVSALVVALDRQNSAFCRPERCKRPRKGLSAPDFGPRRRCWRRKRCRRHKSGSYADNEDVGGQGRRLCPQNMRPETNAIGARAQFGEGPPPFGAAEGFNELVALNT
jgi:hypothetical protein